MLFSAQISIKVEANLRFFQDDDERITDLKSDSREREACLENRIKIMRVFIRQQHEFYQTNKMMNVLRLPLYSNRPCTWMMKDSLPPSLQVGPHSLSLSVGSLLAFRKLLEAENVNSATKHNNALNKFTIHTWARVIVVEWERLLWAAQLLPNFINSSVLSRLFWLCRVSRGERVVMLTIWLMLSS